MSYDLAVWSSKRSIGTAEARRVLEKLAGDEVPPELAPSEALRKFADDVSSLYPPLEALSDREVERSPWAGDPEFHATHALLTLRPSRAGKIGLRIRRLANEKGLICYDPQTNKVHLPPGFAPVSEPDPLDDSWGRFVQLLESLQAGLSEHGYAWDSVSQCFQRSDAGFRRVLGLSLFSATTPRGASAELRAAFTLTSERLAAFRIAREPNAFAGPHELASVDVRRLPDPPAWIGWNLAAQPDLWTGLAPTVLRFFRERGFAYFDSVRNPENLTSPVPGVKPDDAIEYTLALGLGDLSSRIARSILERTPHDPAAFGGAVEAARAGREPDRRLPYAIRAVATMVARHGLAL